MSSDKTTYDIKTLNDVLDYKPFASTAYDYTSRDDSATQDTSRKIVAEINKKIGIFFGDMTCLKVDAIVNAANKNLKNEAGLCGKVFARAGAQALQMECDSLGGCPVGDAKITDGYKCPAKYIIHAVGPVYNQNKDNNNQLLESAYKRSLDVLNANRLTTIAFPCLSTGLYGFPNDAAAKVALGTVRHWLKNNPTSQIERIIFCLFDKTNVDIYRSLFAKYFPFENI